MSQEKKSQAGKNAITPTRQEDYPEWYQQVIKAGELAENSPVRGCMVIKPWGWGIWERIQRELDDRIKETGHENAYFPLFIPLSYLEKEAAHVDGFAKECAVVTHHRLQEQDGKLIPSGELEEPLIVRPTSETIIGETFSKWIQSYRDLPLLINQWANVVRWEMRTRLFLRTSEFLWQEGHTAHATEEEAREETLKMLEVYRETLEDVLAIPVIKGEKTAEERFPGAVNTYTVEAMMQDGKALQAGTSHYLGQNFSKASDIKFSAESGELEFCHTTSWGVSTRLIGGVIMVHGDDDGLRIPPKIAPHQVVILPVLPKADAAEVVFPEAQKLRQELQQVTYAGERLRVKVDERDLRGGEKNWQWIKKGAPVRLEIGPRDIESGKVVLYRRDKGVKEKVFADRSELSELLPKILSEIQEQYFQDALAFRDERSSATVTNRDELSEYFTEGRGGFVRCGWSASPEALDFIGQLKLSVRCIPEDGNPEGKMCVVTGAPALHEVILAKAY